MYVLSGVMAITSNDLCQNVAIRIARACFRTHAAASDNTTQANEFRLAQCCRSWHHSSSPMAQRLPDVPDNVEKSFPIGPQQQSVRCPRPHSANNAPLRFQGHKAAVSARYEVLNSDHARLNRQLAYLVWCKSHYLLTSFRSPSTNLKDVGQIPHSASALSCSYVSDPRSGIRGGWSSILPVPRQPEHTGSGSVCPNPSHFEQGSQPISLTAMISADTS